MAKSAKADLSEFFKYAQPKKPPCKVGFVIGQLPEEEAKQLQAACDQDRNLINTGAIREWLEHRDFEVSVPAITNHRSGTCTCGDGDE